MRLTAEEEAMRTGAFGPAVQWAIDHQIRVGHYLGAADFVPVSQAHIMADTESLGVAGVEWLEAWARLPAEQRRVRVPPSRIRAAPILPPRIASSSSRGCSTSSAVRLRRSRRSAS